MDKFSRRVKIYVLKGQSWEDQGTGFCRCLPIDEFSEKLMFIVFSEEDSSVILSSKISHHTVYQKEQGTLLIWAESPDGPNICLSFQLEEGRDEAHHWIMEAQKRLTPPPSPPPNEREKSPSPVFSLPHPSIDNIGLIVGEFETILRNPYSRDGFVPHLLEQNFLSSITAVYQEARESNNTSALHCLFRILRLLLSLGDPRIIDCFAWNDLYKDIAGIMENDPDMPDVVQNFRSYLEVPNRFREVLPIPDPTIQRKVHESFRLSYLKESVMCRAMDEMINSRFSMLIGQRNLDIINYMGSNPEYLTQVFAMLSDSETSIPHKRDIILFTQQLCNLSKSAPLPVQNMIFRILNQKGLFPIFQFSTSDVDVKVRSIGAEIVAMIIDQDPVQVRFLIKSQLENANSQESESPYFLELLVRSIIDEASPSISAQYADMLRSLLINHGPLPFGRIGGGISAMPDLGGTRRRDQELDQFITFFYNQYVDLLARPLLELNAPPHFTKKIELSCMTIIELMTTFLRFHTHRIKYVIDSYPIVQKTILLLGARAGHVRLSVIRFFRTLIGIKEELYPKLLISHSLLRRLFEFYIQTKSANNLTNSACLELFDFIQKNDISPLIEYLSVNLADELAAVEGTSVFQRILQRFQSVREMTGDTVSVNSPFGTRPHSNSPPAAGSLTSSSSNAPPSQNRDWSSNTLDQEEEQYFEFGYDDEEEEDDVHSAANNGSADSSAHDIISAFNTNTNEQASSLSSTISKRTGPLVDYDDNDEDNDDEDDALLALTKNPKLVVTPIKSKTQQQGPQTMEVHLLKNSIDGSHSSSPSSSSSTSPTPATNPNPSSRQLLEVGVSQPSLRLDSPDFTDLQKEQILHYEEIESKVHLEEPTSLLPTPSPPPLPPLNRLTSNVVRPSDGEKDEEGAYNMKDKVNGDDFPRKKIHTPEIKVESGKVDAEKINGDKTLKRSRSPDLDSVTSTSSSSPPLSKRPCSNGLLKP